MGAVIIIQARTEMHCIVVSNAYPYFLH